MENWNDLKLILAVYRSKSLTGAADVLKVNHSTAFRNLNSIEEKLGARLFERLPGGVYHPTNVGEVVARSAERMETEAHALDREISGTDARLTGTLRVTASETLAYSVLTAHIARFRREQPGITVELTIDNRVLNLSRREADIALRVARPKEPELFGKKLAEIGWTVYGSLELLDGQDLDNPRLLTSLPFVGWSEEVRGVAAADWLADVMAPAQIVYRANGLINQFCAAREGIGLAVLPCYLGDGEQRLRRAIAKPVPELTRELWIVTHLDLKLTARIRAFFDVVGGALAQQRDMFAGGPAT